MTIHPSRRGRCVGCSCEVDRASANTYQRTSGWAQNRAEGGTHALALEARSERFICRWCLDKRQHAESGERWMARDERPKSAPCAFCAVVIDPWAKTSFVHVYGWARCRARGTGAVALIERDTSYACVTCITKLRQGISVDQQTLFGGDVA